jgi:CRP-like cAMP-binding protein
LKRQKTYNIDFSEIDLFSGISEEENSAILNRYTVIKNYKKGEFIFLKGEKPEYMFILISGALSVFSEDQNGKRELLASFERPGELFAEVYLFLKDKNYDFSAVADKDTEVIAISRDFFESMYDFEDKSGKTILLNYMEILSEKLFYFNKKIRTLSGFTLRQKLARFLLENSKDEDKFILQYTREELADYIGATRPSVSRELNNMQSDGLIIIDKDRVEILNRDELLNYT